MSTIWDQAVRALQPVLPSLNDAGHPLAYYCGGPEPKCTHPACRAVSALAEADLIHDPEPTQQRSHELLRLVWHFEQAGASERAWGANYARMVLLGDLNPDQAPTGPHPRNEP